MVTASCDTWIANYCCATATTGRKQQPAGAKRPQVYTKVRSSSVVVLLDTINRATSDRYVQLFIAEESLGYHEQLRETNSIIHRTIFRYDVY